MINTKFLSEAVHYEEVEKGQLNIVNAPVGSGKTHWALNVLSKTVSAPHKMIYLIDTINGKEQLLKNPLTRYYSDDWRSMYHNNDICVWSQDIVEDKIVVMTYAKFGAITHYKPDFGNGFELIICDEIHNLPRFSNFINPCPKRNAISCHKIAKQKLEEIVWDGEATVIGLSATPRRAAEEMTCECRAITVDDDVRRFETLQTIPYTNVDYLLNDLSIDETGIVYIGHVVKMKEFVAQATEKGFRAIAIWSVNNSDHPMTEEQHRVRNHILHKAELPPEYNLFVINASSETSINIFGKVDYIIIHTEEEEAQVQVRGRYRNDLKSLYVLDYDAVPVVPPEFMGIKLFKEDKERLCQVLNRRNKYDKSLKWTSVKSTLIENGYTLTEGRQKNLRFAIITK